MPWGVTHASLKFIAARTRLRGFSRRRVMLR